MRLFGPREIRQSVREPRRLRASYAEAPATLSDVLRRTQDRIDAVADAAELAVEQVRGDLDPGQPWRQGGAAPESTRIDREALVEQLLESLAARTEGLQSEAAALAKTLKRAGAQLERSGPAKPVPATPPPVEIDRQTAPQRLALALRQDRRGAPTSRSRGGKVPDGVRLLATQMAVAGSSMSEVESRLRREFGVADPGPVLDEVFGREVES